ncbi:tRNA (guanine(10)-N(2))-dimethyltransferase [Candidatus Woesearchaeota archaeon]|nr:tRNA (guanine(10)-N(2))-dimethyltransferase [Candidatus Woesearchaeota archaeon]
MEKKIKEGKVFCKIYSEQKVSKELPVFYNPVMKMNRDITIELLRAQKRNHLQVADILAASGIRSIRLIKELPARKIKNILVNDCSENAVELIKENLKLNHLDFNASKDKITVSCNDANKALLDGKGFDYIDIDPFGSPNPFIDSSIKRLARDGILAVTATDTSALAGTFENACKRKYWAKPMRNELMHEIGIRILIRKAQLIASQYEKALTPILSYSAQHYMRIFFVCEKGKEKADAINKQHKYVLCCNKCMKIDINHFNNIDCKVDSKTDSRNDDSKNDDCNQQMQYAGPCWVGEINKQETVKAILDNVMRNKLYKEETELLKLLQLIKEESTINIVGFYDIHALVKKNNLKQIPKFDLIVKNCKQNGFKAVRTHFNEYAIKTTAPIDVITKIISEFNTSEK